MTPVIVEIKSGKALFMGCLAGFIGVMWWSMGLAFWLSARMDDDAPALMICVGLIITAYAVHYLGVAIRKPVALRMDAKGISGYYAEPAIWPEIMAIEIFDGSKGQQYLGFAFLNPDIIGARQSLARKVFNWVHDPRSRYQIVVPGYLLRTCDLERLAAEAEIFRRAA